MPKAVDDIRPHTMEGRTELAALSHPVDAPCVVCGTQEHAIVCSAREVISQHRYLRRFHRRRLHLNRKPRPTDSALADRVNFTQDYATDIVSCTSCGLLFRNPRPPRESVIAAYAADHYDDEHLATALHTHLPLSRSKAKTLAGWLPQREGLRIVEVGSFVGSFLVAGREQGWVMVGVDPGEQAVSFCKAKGLPVFRGILPHLRLPPRSIDCVAIWNTFDQMPDPHLALDAACDLLRPGGLFTIRVPNGACFASALSALRHSPRWVSRWFRAALAWNNLLMFPYLIGYSVSPADRLMRRHDLHRIAVYPDTLVSLSDSLMKRWARYEERLIKFACRAFASAEAMQRDPAYSTGPWLDIYYRKGNSTGVQKKNRLAESTPPGDEM